MAMKTKRLSLRILLVGLLTTSGPAFAHHSWHGLDKSNQTTVKGIVTNFDWSNPHVWITVEVKDDKGSDEKWSAGGPSPSRLANKGWDKDTIKPGDEISITGARSTDGSHQMRLDKITLPDGRELPCYGSR